MDTDSLPPLLIPTGLILAGSLCLFFFLSLAEHAGSNGGGILRDNSPSQRAWFVLSPFKYACVIVIVLSGYFLIRPFLPQAWLSVPILSLALLVLLTLIHRVAFLLAARNPALVTRCAGPLLKALRRGEERIRTGAAAKANGKTGGESAEQSDPPTLDITEEELVSMDRHDREMLRSIIQLDNSTAHEIMIPRLDVIALEIETPLRQAIEPIITSGHTRIPVYNDTIDHIVGIIHSLDLLQLLSRDDWSQTSLRELLRPAYFIPENKRLDDLLEEFQQKAVQMAIVVDEYGGTEGIITLEDLLEEIVGEIEDEFSRTADPEIALEEDGAALVSASVTNDVIEEMFSAKLDNQDVDTIGGYVYMSLGRMPHVGDVVETESLTIEVTSVLGRRIHKVRIRTKQAAAV